jgi:two-component system OmpR family response regulator
MRRALVAGHQLVQQHGTSKGEEVMAAGKTILAVDDDPAMRRLISDYLSQHDFSVIVAETGQEMLHVLAEASIDLVLLDMRLANEDGLALIRDLRPRSDVPIIVLTGSRREQADRIIGLELGADDYVLKPFSPRELVARIRAVLRRTELRESLRTNSEKRVRYRFGGWELDLRTHRLSTPAGEPVLLTNGEFNLLVAFLRSPEKVLSREYLLEATRLHPDVFDRSIDAQILRLRRKLEADPSQPSLIRTERGAGYLFASPVQIS